MKPMSWKVYLTEQDFDLLEMHLRELERQATVTRAEFQRLLKMEKRE